ncbi:MAG: hypothetical protein ABI851_01590 [Saprospiraceae bacterium]
MKLIFFSIFYLVCNLKNSLVSQTQVCTVFGYDFQKVVAIPSFPIEIVKNGSSPIIGIQIKQRIYKSLFFNYLANYTYKKVKLDLNGSVYQHYLYRYHSFRNNLSIMYVWHNKLYIELGQSYNTLYDFKYESEEDPNSISNLPHILNENGLIFSMGIKYRKYDFGIYYYLRRNYSKFGNIYYYFLSEVYNLGFKLSYEFQVLDSFNRKKKLECPDFK